MTTCPECGHLKAAHNSKGHCLVWNCGCLNKNFAQPSSVTITVPAYVDTAEGEEPNPQLTARIQRSKARMEAAQQQAEDIITRITMDPEEIAAAALEQFAAEIPMDAYDPRHIADMARAKAAEIRARRKR
jgi:hypothetical protein